MAHASESGHWYDRQGNPVYEVDGAKGQKVTPDIRHARKYGLLPGSTSILKCQDKPQLTKWLINQAVLSALTLPRVDGESNDDLLRRIEFDRQEQSNKAAARGTAIHAAIQGHFEGQPPDPEYWPFVKGVVAKLREVYGDQNWVAEKSFGCHHGYGGKVDLHCSIVVLDFKTKEFTSEDLKNPKFRLAWDEHAQQGSSYRRGLKVPKAKVANAFVSVTEPGLVYVHEWEEDDLSRSLGMFDALLAYWKLKNRYDSAFEPMREAA